MNELSVENLGPVEPGDVLLATFSGRADSQMLDCAQRLHADLEQHAGHQEFLVLFMEAGMEFEKLSPDSVARIRAGLDRVANAAT